MVSKCRECHEEIPGYNGFCPSHIDAGVSESIIQMYPSRDSSATPDLQGGGDRSTDSQPKPGKRKHNEDEDELPCPKSRMTAPRSSPSNCRANLLIIIGRLPDPEDFDTPARYSGIQMTADNYLTLVETMDLSCVPSTCAVDILSSLSVVYQNDKFYWNYHLATRLHSYLYDMENTPLVWVCPSTSPSTSWARFVTSNWNQALSLSYGPPEQSVQIYNNFLTDPANYRVVPECECSPGTSP